jgi:hypothetical protein
LDTKDFVKVTEVGKEEPGFILEEVRFEVFMDVCGNVK